MPTHSTNNTTIHAELLAILNECVASGASDAHVVSGERIFFRVEGELRPRSDDPLSGKEVEHFAQSILGIRQLERLNESGSVDGAISLDDESRFRFNAYIRDGETCIAFRLLPNHIPGLQDLGLTDELYQLSRLRDGLILVAGPTGSGKSTTIASLIDRINQTQARHIVTIEDPIEFVHKSSRSLVNQRQVGTDVPSFRQALIDSVRQDPDVILVGELRDAETIQTAISAAETGHLVFASIHAGDAKTTIERLIGAFSAEEQNLAQRLTASVLRCVIVQQLLPQCETPDQQMDRVRSPRRVLASEVLQVNSAIANLIVKGNLNQIASMIESSGDAGMWTLDASLARLWRTRMISQQTASSLARNPELLLQLSQHYHHAHST